MTQLSLFDAPVPATIPNTAAPQSLEEAVSNGPQRVGNLAHLVLARYDMVARRREAQRRRAAARANQPAIKPAVEKVFH